MPLITFIYNFFTSWPSWSVSRDVHDFVCCMFSPCNAINFEASNWPSDHISVRPQIIQSPSHFIFLPYFKHFFKAAAVLNFFGASICIGQESCCLPYKRFLMEPF